MKKKILFVIPSLGAGGAEKSLIELLKRFDYNNYDIDLLVFNLKGLFSHEIPENVNVISLNDEEKVLLQSSKQSIKTLLKSKRYLEMIMKLAVSLVFKVFKKWINDSVLLWKSFNRYFDSVDKEYDVTIAYLQGICAYYSMDKTKARKKILWMHTDYGSYSKNSKYDRNYNNKFDEVITVSESAKENFINYHPKKVENVHVVYNMIDVNSIIKFSKAPNELDKSKINIVSVGRLHYAKGFDLVLPAIRKLRDQGLDINWYVVGEGPERNELNTLINKYRLEYCCYLLGEKENPYTYMNSADIYLQSSRYEGYCITLAEAKTLCKPIVTTDFFGAKEQIEDFETGIIVECTTEDIYLGLKKLIEDNQLSSKFIKNLSLNSGDNQNEIYKVYELIDK